MAKRPRDSGAANGRIKWKRVPNSNYEVSSDGQVRINLVRLVKPVPSGSGRKILAVRIGFLDKTYKTMSVQKLVAQAFLPPRPSPKHVLIHKDTNHKRNGANNLKWVQTKDVPSRGRPRR